MNCESLKYSRKHEMIETKAVVNGRNCDEQLPKDAGGPKKKSHLQRVMLQR